MRSLHSKEDGPTLGIYVLTLASHAIQRCFQRTAIHSFAVPTAEAGGWLRIVGGGSMLLRYVYGYTAHNKDTHVLILGLIRENTTYGDLLVAQFPESTSACFHKVVFALRRAVAQTPHAPDWVMLADDDAFIHPPRLLQDLRPLLGHSRERDVLYGYAYFNAGWRPQEHTFQFGYNQYNTGAHQLWHEWQHRFRRRRSPTRIDGPFPTIYGFGMTLSLGLAQHVAHSLAVDAFLEETSHASSLGELPPRRVTDWCPQGRTRPCCDPTSDATLSWSIAHLDPPRSGVTLIDVLYSNRIQLSRSESSERELRSRTAVVHLTAQAAEWETGYRWALCTSARDATKTGRLMTDRATVTRCRAGHNASLLHCGAMGCRGTTNLVHKGSACEREPRCAAYYNSTFSNWNFCVAAGSRWARRAAVINRSICNASTATVLSSCGLLSPVLLH